MADGSSPTSPTSAGSSTSPTGTSPTAPRSRSSTSSTTTPGSASPATPGGSSPAPRCGSVFPAAISRWGPPARLLTDNGAVFTGNPRGSGRVALEVTCGARGIRFPHSRPYHPQTCGKVERFHQTLKKWLDRQPRPATVGQLQAQLDQFRRYYNTDPAAPRPRPSAPRPGLRRPPQSRPHRPRSTPATTASATTTSTTRRDHPATQQPAPPHRPRPPPRRHPRPRPRSTTCTSASSPPTANSSANSPSTRPGTTNPADYHPARPNAHTAATPPAGIPIPAITAARSRSQDWPKATRRAPALTTARTAPPSPAGMPKQPQKCNDVPRHLSTVSRDITLAHPEGFEPPTF